MKLFVDITMDVIKPFQIKASRKRIKETHITKSSDVSIYQTTQGTAKNIGINIDIRKSEFLDYANINIYEAFGKLFFELPTSFSNDSYRLSINRSNSKICTVKVAEKNNVNRLINYIGEWRLSEVYDNLGTQSKVYILEEV